MQGYLFIFNFALLLILMVIVILLYKIHKIQLALAAAPSKHDVDNLYQQFEALFSLYRDLRFEKALPALRGYAGSPDFLREVAGEVLRRKPENILELGSGASTLILAKALQRNGKGHLYSVEHDELYAEQTRKWLHDYKLERYVTIISSSLTDYSIDKKAYRWFALNNVPMMSFDVLVVDGPPTATQQYDRYPALPLLQSRLSSETVIFVDDADRLEEKELLSRWSESFPHYQQQRRSSEKGCVVLQRVKLSEVTTKLAQSA